MVKPPSSSKAGGLGNSKLGNSYNVPDYQPGTTFEAHCIEALEHVHCLASCSAVGIGGAAADYLCDLNRKNATPATGAVSVGLPMIPHTTRKAMMERAAAPPVKPTLRGSSANRSHFDQQQHTSKKPSDSAYHQSVTSHSRAPSPSPSSSMNGITEPQLCAFMDRTRRVGGEYSTSLISRMISAALSASVNTISNNNTSSVAVVTGNDIARCVQANMPYGTDWTLLIEFLLQHKDLHEGLLVKKRSVEVYRPPPQRPQTQQVIGRRSLQKSSIVTSARFASSSYDDGGDKSLMTPNQAAGVSAAGGGGTMTSWGGRTSSATGGSPSPRGAQLLQGSGKIKMNSQASKSRSKVNTTRSDIEAKPILDYLPFKESKHPAWSVHYEVPTPPTPTSGVPLPPSASRSPRETSLSTTTPRRGGGRSGRGSRGSAPGGGGIDPSGTLSLGSNLGSSLNGTQSLMALQGIDLSAVVCCRASNRGKGRQLTPGETMESLVARPAGVRAVVVDLDKVMQSKGDHFSATISCQGLTEGATLPDCWGGGAVVKQETKKPIAPRTIKQINCINAIVAYIER